jgi:hypothetical protein
MMVNIVGSKDDYNRFKPDGMEDHLTVAEVCAIVKRHPTRIKQLEKAGVLPKPIRVKVGRLQVRLYTSQQGKKIEQHFKTAKPGNPKLRRPA